MGEVRLMAAGDHHRRPVPFADVGQGEDDVALPAAEHAVLEAIGPAQRALVAAGVDGVVPAGAADRGDGFVNKQALHIGVLLPAIAADMAEPAGMVNQRLERGARPQRSYAAQSRSRRCNRAAGRCPTTASAPAGGKPSKARFRSSTRAGATAFFSIKVAVQVEQEVIQRGRGLGFQVSSLLTRWLASPGLRGSRASAKRA